jgi:pilus assembly protein CpaB
VDEVNAVGDRVKPGNFVDVFFMLKRDGAAGGAEIDTTQARLLLSRVRVLSFGDATLAGAADPADGSNAGGTQGARGPARTAVLAVATGDVNALTLAQSAGQLTLALRNPADRDVAEPLGMEPLLASLKAHADADASARAAAGVSLAALAGTHALKGAATPLAPAAKPAPLQARVAARVVSNEMEVIRAGHSEKVAY